MHTCTVLETTTKSKPDARQIFIWSTTLIPRSVFFRHECWRAICLRLVTFSPFSLVAQHPIDNSSCWSKILLLEKIELGWLHDVDEKTKGDAAYDVGHLPRLLEDCNQLLPGGFISACRTHRTERLQVNCLEFIRTDHWPPNSPDLSPMNYHVWVRCWRPTTSSIQNPKSIIKKNHCRWSGQPTTRTDTLKRCAIAGCAYFEHT